MPQNGYRLRKRSNDNTEACRGKNANNEARRHGVRITWEPIQDWEKQDVFTYLPRLTKKEATEIASIYRKTGKTRKVEVINNEPRKTKKGASK